MQVSDSLRILRSRKAIVVRVVDEAPAVKTFTLRIEGEHDIKPGQFNMIYYWGIGEAPISLANLPVRSGGSTIIEHTVRSTGIVTNTIIEEARTGSILGVRGPYGKGWPLDKHENMNMVIVAGGIGLAPLRPVIKYIEKNRGKGLQKRKHILITRTQNEMRNRFMRNLSIRTLLRMQRWTSVPV
jgi:NAD(P)H-flavin reductase